MLRWTGHVAVMVMVVLMTAGGALAQSSASDEPKDIEAFVMAEYTLGIPCVQAQAFGSAYVPRLLDLLADPAYEPYWENVVVTLGCIGDPAAVRPLEAFLVSHKGEISFHTFNALQGVPTALGFISQNGNEDALDLLTNLARENYWEDANLKVFDMVVNEAIVKKSLKRSTIVALGYSEQEEARWALRLMKEDPDLEEDLKADIEKAIHEK